MPAGLDGNPDPISTQSRNDVLSAVARIVAATADDSDRILVAVDGRSGAGKSTFADELEVRLRKRGLATLRSTTDSFHRPRAERMRLGSTSADGYYLDSHQLGVIVDELLDPFVQGAATVRIAAFDEPNDESVFETSEVERRAVLIFDGLFLQRQEFRDFWSCGILLEADDRLDARWLQFLLSDLPLEPSERAAAIDARLDRARWPRYRDGWARYLETDDPAGRACVVVDNNDLGEPRIIKSTR